jgi:hypothetical protein
MPSDVAVLTGLTYAATDLQDFPRVFFEIVEGGPDFTPEVRGEDRTVPYRSGQVYAPRRNHRLPILLQGWVAGEGEDEAAQRADTATARQEMRVLFDPTAGLATLTVTTEDGTDWSIEAYPESLVWEARPQVPTHWPGMVRLIAIGDPATGDFWVATGGGS